MTPERLAEIAQQAGALTYEPTRRAALELLAEVERLTVENEHLTVDAEMDGSVKRLLRAEVERLRAELMRMATGP